MVTTTRPSTETTPTPELEGAPKIIDAMRLAQANATVMYLNAKRYHWFTYGPLFRDIHLFWDEVAAAALAEIDPLAERVRMLGGDPLSQPSEIERCASVRVAEGKPAVRAMFEEALANERQIITEMRDAAKLADDEGDPGTNDLFGGLVQQHEKHAWFIAEFLRGDDGMR